VAGRPAEAKKVLENLDQLAKTRYVSPTDYACVYLGLGQKDVALKYLEQACEEHDGWVFVLKVEPWYAPLRHEPRFQKLVNLVENGGRTP
jgi:hypothetical protein